MVKILNDAVTRLVATPQELQGLSGGYDGAKRFDQQLQSWNPALRSADAEILPEKYMLDARSRDVTRNDALVQGGGTVHKDSIVGGMFMLNAKPKHALFPDGMDADWAEEFQQEVEPLFTLWAESPMNYVDAARRNDFTSMIRLAVGVQAVGGEFLAVAEWIERQDREFKTAIKLVDTDRLSTPFDMVWDPAVRAGIRHGVHGEPVTAYIRKAHPHDYQMLHAFDGMFWKAVRFYKPWGRQQVIYLAEQTRVEQTRAVADMVSALKEIAITKRFRDVTLQNAVVNAMYAATIESELPSEIVYQQMGAGKTGQAVTSYAQTYLGAVAEYLNQGSKIQIDGVKVPHLFPGTKLNMRPAGTPGGVGQDFEVSLLRYIAASLNISYEELSRDYSKTNYSSARAALNQSWKFMRSRKRLIADRLANSIYRLWLEEAIWQNRLTTFPASKASMLYTNGHLNLAFDALAHADWIGASRGQIDELKETQAAVLRIKYGLSTHEDELSRLGKDWRQVFEQLEREKKELRERNIMLEEDDNMMNAASGSPRDSDEGAGTERDADEG